MKQPKFHREVTAEFVRLIYLTSPLHDIGKVAIPDGVLLKPGKLTDEEFEIMQTHTVHADARGGVAGIPQSTLPPHGATSPPTTTNATTARATRRLGGVQSAGRADCRSGRRLRRLTQAAGTKKPLVTKRLATLSCKVRARNSTPTSSRPTSVAKKRSCKFASRFAEQDIRDKTCPSWHSGSRVPSSADQLMPPRPVASRRAA